METHTIKFHNVELEVTGKYYKGSFGDWETPPEASEFEIESATINGINVNDLFDGFDCWNELENLIIDKCYD